MRGLLRRLWELPWPPRVRRRAHVLVQIPWVGRLLFPRFMVGVMGLVSNERGEVLCLRHTYRAEHPWGLPTGIMERREQPESALRREVEEETGLRVDDVALYSVYASPERSLVNLVYTARYQGGDFVASSEVSEARFFPPDRLPPLRSSQTRLVQAWLNDQPPSAGELLKEGAD